MKHTSKLGSMVFFIGCCVISVTEAKDLGEPMQMYIRSQDDNLFVIFAKPVDNVFDLFAQLQLLEHIEAFWIDSDARQLLQ